MNTFGNNFRLTTFGESHGPAIGGIIDGCPAGVAIDFEFINQELRRRREGDEPSPLTTARKEADCIEWLSGIYDGTTIGTPLAFCVRNNDCHSSDYDLLKDCCRPGHADYTYQEKYGIRDHRGGGRASGRETVARVIAGAIAKQLIQQKGITISSTVKDFQVSCTIKGLSAGVGNPIFDRLNARLSYSAFSIPSAASFVMGDAPDSWQRADFADQWNADGRGETLTKTNHCGGIQGGISNGMPVIFHVGFHRPVTKPEGMICRNNDGSLTEVAPHGRHDADHSSRLPVIVESMAALTIADLINLENNK